MAIIQATFVAAVIATVLTGTAILVALMRIASGGGLAHLDGLDGHDLSARASDVSARLRTRYLARRHAPLAERVFTFVAEPFEPTADERAVWAVATIDVEDEASVAAKAA